MAVSLAYRRSVKRRTRRSRRWEVCSFFLMMAIALVCAGKPLDFRGFVFRLTVYVFPLCSVFRDWDWNRLVKVTSLDDRAMNEYGVEFEQATEAQQKDLLKRYRVGTYLLNYFPDEYEEMQQRESYQQAYSTLRILLPSGVVVYWLGWKLLPQGYARDAWTNGPVVLYWLSLLIIAMPQIIRMWTEPDDPAEPRLVETAHREA
jgi:hypothetical protein